MFLEYITAALAQITRTDDAPSIVNEQKLDLMILERGQVAFVTDGQICIQALMWGIGADQPNPFNRLRHPYYNFHAKHAKFFNFGNQQPQTDKSQYIRPYEPRFFFGDSLSEFMKNKTVQITPNTFEFIEVTKWKTKIVNIANTVYYGVILEILEYNKLYDKKLIIREQSLILYDCRVRRQLERIWLSDWRAMQPKIPEKKRPSLFYYMKTVKVAHTTTPRFTFVVIDKTSKIIKTAKDEKAKIYCITLGKLEGVQRFIRPLTNMNQIDHYDYANINFSKLDKLAERRNREQVEIELVSSSDEDDDDSLQMAEESDAHQGDQDCEQEDEESSEEEEPLRLLYLKQMKNRLII